MDEKEVNIQRNLNYSKEDGTMQKFIDTRNYTTKKVKFGSCEECGYENNSIGSYCENCGSELYIIEENKEKEKNRYDIKQIIKTSLSSVVMLLIVSIIYKAIIFMEGSDINEFVNPLQILLAMNLGKIDIFTTSMFSASSLSIQLGMIVMIVIPIIALSVSNLLFMKKGSESVRTIVLKSVFVGVTYGCILGVISIFTKSRVNTRDMLMYSGGLVYGFSMFSVMINGFILGFISTFAVGVFKFKEKIMSIEIIKLAFKSIGLGIICILLILGLLSFFNKNFIHDLGLYSYTNKISLGVVLLQLAVYLWAFANLIPVAIGNISLSILGLGGINILSDTKLLIIAMIFISLLILIVVGNKLKNKYIEDSIKPVKYFSIAYALMMGTISILTTITVSGNNVSSLAMGFGLITSVLISYIYSFVVTLIGYKLS